MDPFENLPAEIRELVLIHAATPADVVAMTHASPVLFQQRRHSQVAILQGTYPDFCDPILLNYSIALSSFQKSSRNQDEDKKRILYHLERWRLQKLPNPLREGKFWALLQLERIWARITAFSDDFVEKATSSHLREAYINLPDWSDPLLHLRTRPSQTHHSNLDSLTMVERKRILRSFLQFEIISRLVQHQLRGRSSSLSLLYWPHHSFEELELDMLEFFEWRELPTWEVEGIACVLEYLRTMYDAVQ